MTQSICLERLFHQNPAPDLLLDQFPVRAELHFDFDLLETAILSDQPLADEIDCVIAFIVQAEVVVKVHAPFDDLAAAIAFDVEGVIPFFRPGGFAAEKFFEKAHDLPFMSLQDAGEAISRLAGLILSIVLTGKRKEGIASSLRSSQ
jgi:hypothetical protein